MNPLNPIKEELKALGRKIRATKNKRKQDKRGDTPLYKLEYTINSLKYEFRHKHIAYCLIRGRTREEIENPASDNLPSESLIEKYVNEYGALIRPGS